MKCIIALDINKGAYPKTVVEFGAKGIAANALTTVHPRNLEVKTVTPTIEELNSASTFTKGASYIFSNSKPTTPAGLEKM
mgnify:FL=1